jgi:putative ABC transport system permease protein
MGIFLASSSATMTERAVAGVPIDWQVELTANADAATVRNAIVNTPTYQSSETVEYASVAGLSADTGGTVQTTGPGKVLGISRHYAAAFPRVIRRLTGSEWGILVAQQTAANLHVKEGDTVTIMRIGLSPARVTVDGVVDLPFADSLFQAIGVPAGAAPQAPPDNVLLLPHAAWHGIFDPQAQLRPDTIQTQFHVKLSGGRLPADPAAAYTYVTHLANNLEARAAGSALVGNNLAARLAAVRADALYARVLFLFLGLPGVILGILLTLSVAASGRRHLLQEQALLRVRGASTGRITRYESAEALIVGAGGILLGAAFTVGAGRALAPVTALVNRLSLGWLAGAAAAGLLLAVSAVVFPAWRQARRSTVMGSRALVRVPGNPLWERLYLDVLLLGIAVFVYWRTAQGGYQVVLAPEGVPQISVHYEAFLAPLCFWLGGVLLARRIWENGAPRARRPLSRLLRGIAGNLSGVVAASLERQRLVVGRGILLVALAFAFAVSTATFNTTYNAQARVDAELTNGADVTVTGSTGAPAGLRLADIRKLPGVDAAQPMLHRFTYVGSDLQDIYGIDPAHIGEATRMSNAYFAGGNAAASLALLARHPDGVLVSEETRQDFQLNAGDHLDLRLQFAADHQYHTVPFRFVGVVREFPTAPKDSFLVANSAYIASQTGSSAREVVLVKASGDPVALAAQVEQVVSALPGTKVTDIASAHKAVSSSLTSVDLHGLTRLELVFAVLMVMGATGLVFALGLNERRRNFALLGALGARGGQLGAFMWSEALVVLLGGAIAGTLLGVGVAQILVTGLKGVFDPPPEHLILPWGYVAILAVSSVLATAGAVVGARRMTLRPVVEELRRL